MFLIAVSIGIILGFLEWVILLASRQKLQFWIYVQSVLYWFTVGVMIGIINLPIPSFVSGALIALFLTLPWFINISIIPKQYKHLLPLILSSILLGALGGFLKTLLS